MNMTRKKHMRGFSLLEVLIALVILAIGMLGISRMLLITHKSNSSSYVRQHAVQSAYNILDRIHANRQAAIDGSYTINNLVAMGVTPTMPSTPATNCDSTLCSTTDLATFDTWHWLSNDVAQLPNGCASIGIAVSGVNRVVTVTVQWDDSPAQAALGTPSTSPSQLIIQSAL